MNSMFTDKHNDYHFLRILSSKVLLNSCIFFFTVCWVFGFDFVFFC